jgi:hypothetical protein
MHKRVLIQTAAALFALQFLAVPVYAAGSSGGSDETVTQCKKGQVWDKKKKKCVAPQEGMLDDDSIYDAGRIRASSTISAIRTAIPAASPLASAITRKRCASIPTIRWCANISAKRICRSAIWPAPSSS